MSEQAKNQLLQLLSTASTNQEKIDILKDIKDLSISKYGIAIARLENKKRQILEIHEKRVKNLQDIIPLDIQNIKNEKKYNVKQFISSFIDNTEQIVKDLVLKKQKVAFFDPSVSS